MYAIVDIAGQQFKVEQKQKVYVHRLEANEGDVVEFKDVLLYENNGKIQVGAPLVAGAVVSAKVLGNVKGDKVIIFKKRRRKGYRVLNGHRQYFTQLFIQGIAGQGETLKIEEAPVAKAISKDLAKATELVKKAPAKKTAKKAEAAEGAEAKVKKAPAKKAAKKAAPKKTKE